MAYGSGSGRRFCHVIVLDEDGEQVTATQTPCGWMLPLVPQPQASAVEFAYQAALSDLLGGEMADHRLIHAARFEHPPESGKIHAYCLVQRRTRITSTGKQRRWWTIGGLLSNPAAFAEQGAALRLAVQRLTNPAGAFDGCAASADMESWIRRVLTEIDPSNGLDDIVWRRRARNDAVGTCYTVRGNRMFVKGGGHRAHQEALLAEALDGCVPGSAPATLALDRERGWWLVADVGGYQLPPSHRTAAWFVKAIDTCTDLQRALHLDGGAYGLLGERIADAASLAELVPWIVERGFENSTAPATSEAASVERALMDMLDRLASLETSRHWVHFDLSFDNIHILRDGALCLIDLEYGCLGAPILSYGILLQDAMSRGRATGRACEERIVSRWTGSGRERERWHASLRDLPVLSLMLKLFVLRRRLADHAAESVSTIDVLYGHTFANITRHVVTLLESHRVGVAA